MHPKFVAFAFALSIVVFAPGAEADWLVDSILTGGQGMPTAPPGTPGAPESSGFSGSAGGGILFEQINEDYFTTLEFTTKLSIGPVSLGVWVPLRFRVLDNDPQNGSVIRKEDWDEPSDYARLLRFIEVNVGGDTWRFRGRAGALDNESIGHGTILAGYYNSLDRNHYQAGIALSTAFKFGGVEFMLDNFIKPEIFGARVHVRPTSFFTDNEWANRLVLGASYVADTHAPVALINTSADATVFVPQMDSTLNYQYTSTQVLSVAGVDVEYTILRNSLIDLVPYADLNFLIDNGAGGAGTGAGFHLGVFFNIRIPGPIGPTLFTRLEYRRLGDGYLPRYVDSTYEGQRVQYDPSRPEVVPITKLGWLRTPEVKGGNGWLGELYFDFAGWVKVGGTYEDFDGPDNAALTLALILPKIPRVELGGLFTRRGFDGFSDLFDLHGALLTAFARARVWGPLMVVAEYERTWARDAATGHYKAEDSWNAGVQLSFSF